MSLPPPAPRVLKHTRRIVCDGYLREDGLWDIEARIVDTKSYPYTEPMRGPRAVGEPVHDMMVRLTVGNDMIVRDIEVSFESNPYPSCLGAAPGFKGLVGATVGPGWRKAVQACVGGTKGCTHVRELLFPMATVAFQTMGGWTADGEEESAPPEVSETHKPYFLDGCRAWASDGDVVREFHPQWYRGAGKSRG